MTDAAGGVQGASSREQFAQRIADLADRCIGDQLIALAERLDELAHDAGGLSAADLATLLRSQGEVLKKQTGKEVPAG